MVKKILITGAAGFVGSNLCKKILENDHHVVGIDNLTAGTLENVPEGVEFYNVDIRDSSISPLFKNVDCVFHLAAKNCLIDCLNNTRETSDVNVNGTVNILESAKLGGVKRFVYADSSAVYEGTAEFPSKVDSAKPLGAYAISKYSGGLFVKMYEDFFDLNTTVLRYFNVYGPAQDYRRVVPPVISSFIMKILKGEKPLIYGDGSKSRDYIHVDDVNDFHLKVLDDDNAINMTCNLGTGTDYTVIQILEMIQELMGTDIDPLFANDLPGEAHTTRADISKEIALGWRPEVDIKTGIASSIDYLKEQLAKEVRAYDTQ